MKIKEREEAKALRDKGYSIKEIADMLKIAKSSVSLWVRNVPLSLIAKNRLLSKIKLGQFNAGEKKKEKVRQREKQLLKEAQGLINDITFDKNIKKIICALIFWCEGTKNATGGAAFINSDPHLVKKFKDLFLESFSVDRGRMKALLHLHTYHDVDSEIDFWSKAININKDQFLKPYIKPNTGKRIRDGYHGCVSLRYNNADIARQLLALAKAFLNKGA